MMRSSVVVVPVPALIVSTLLLVVLVASSHQQVQAVHDSAHVSSLLRGVSSVHTINEPASALDVWTRRALHWLNPSGWAWGSADHGETSSTDTSSICSIAADVTSPCSFMAFVNGQAVDVELAGASTSHSSSSIPLSADDGSVTLVLKAFCSIPGFDAKAIIAADIDVCGTVLTTDGSWKCVSSYPDGSWASPDYDDSNWPIAVTYGIPEDTLMLPSTEYIGGSVTAHGGPFESFCRKTVTVANLGGAPASSPPSEDSGNTNPDLPPPDCSGSWSVNVVLTGNASLVHTDTSDLASNLGSLLGLPQSAPVHCILHDHHPVALPLSNCDISAPTELNYRFEGPQCWIDESVLDGIVNGPLFPTIFETHTSSSSDVCGSSITVQSPSTSPPTLAPAPPTDTPTSLPTASPTAAPSPPPTPAPTSAPSSQSPSAAPTSSPTPSPTASPSAAHSPPPSPAPTATPAPTDAPQDSSISRPSHPPSAAPTSSPNPAPNPSFPSPTASPTAAPTSSPSSAPTASPTASPSPLPTGAPSVTPSSPPSAAPTFSPSPAPTASPTEVASSPFLPQSTPPDLPPVLNTRWQLRIVVIGNYSLYYEDPSAVASRFLGMIDNVYDGDYVNVTFPSGYVLQANVSAGNSSNSSTSRLLQQQQSSKTCAQDGISLTLAYIPVSITGDGVLDRDYIKRVIREPSFSQIWTDPSEYCGIKDDDFRSRPPPPPTEGNEIPDNPVITPPLPLVQIVTEAACGSMVESAVEAGSSSRTIYKVIAQSSDGGDTVVALTFSTCNKGSTVDTLLTVYDENPVENSKATALTSNDDDASCSLDGGLSTVALNDVAAGTDLFVQVDNKSPYGGDVNLSIKCGLYSQVKRDGVAARGP